MNRDSVSATLHAPLPGDAHATEENGGGGNGLLWVLVAVAVLFAFLHPRAPMDWLRLVDWQTVGALAGLLAITQGVEKSGMLQATAQRLLARTHNQRSLAML
ncbi:di/tricarboxylate transporter, partial [Variovorax sp. 1140]